MSGTANGGGRPTAQRVTDGLKAVAKTIVYKKKPIDDQPYRLLRPEKIIETQEMLFQRIEARFPGSGLAKLAGEVLGVAQRAMVRAEQIHRPNLLLRLGIALVVAVAAGYGCLAATTLKLRGAELRDVGALMQFADSSLGTLVFLGAALFFLFSLEQRWKREAALAALHELRALAHVVDMHQMTKDPERLFARGPLVFIDKNPTARTPFELNRYLSYCNEILAILSKIAALYVQKFPDAPTVSAVDQVEDLCSGLSNRICQKILVL
ncbi:MAG: hypothetical protein ACRDD1_14230, partial [Planctomycetia bacterium]